MGSGSQGRRCPAVEPRRHAGEGRSRGAEDGRAFIAASEADPMTMRHIVVRAADVVYIKGLLEASRGMATMFAEKGGELTLVGSRDFEAAIDEFLADLSAEIPLRHRSAPPPLSRDVTGAPSGLNSEEGKVNLGRG